MKSLNHYTDEAITKALNDYGAFYAFSDAQFEEQRDPAREKSEYARGPSGLIVPKDNAEALISAMQDAVAYGITARLLDYPLNDIIAYELGNYECYYSGDIQDAVDALKPYNVTYDDVVSVYNNTKNDQN